MAQLQWSNLTNIKWKENKKTIQFWTEVLTYKDAAGNNPFKELAEFVFRLLILPLSNAEVERLFSQMNLVKTKIRNRIHSDMLNAILTIRASLKRSEKCCHNFDIPKDVWEQIGNTSIYNSDIATDIEDALMMDIVIPDE